MVTFYPNTLWLRQIPADLMQDLWVTVGIGRYTQLTAISPVSSFLIMENLRFQDCHMYFFCHVFLLPGTK